MFSKTKKGYRNASNKETKNITSIWNAIPNLWVENATRDILGSTEKIVI